ncbi:DUF1642 domain-containing protein [Enterococcus avium]|uniref:DUF1642 domain-containing protein n=1 Tax=Enterococcus avium TaxID=33945 RepID=UPI000F4D51E6|nr:DUF1642 domain-containing protein [Enterococcus avium]ROZ26250.1 DUF1642 domain-containing protein [Enterococcus avium]
MNKQELIEKYRRIYHVSSKAGYRSDPFSRGEDAGSARCSFEIIDDLKKLDEPQRVKMPECVVKWLKYCKKNNYPLSAATYDKNIKSFEEASNQTKLLEWFDTVQNQDVFARAWLDGYEVEEKPKFVVKQKDGFYIEGLLKVEGKTYAKKFDSEAEAYKWAELCSGMIEKV